MSTEIRKRRRQHHQKKNSPTLESLNPVARFWDVEYECGLHILTGPATADSIEGIVAKKSHSCHRDKCRAWRFMRITDRNYSNLGWEAKDVGMGSNSGKLSCKADKVRN